MPGREGEKPLSYLDIYGIVGFIAMVWSILRNKSIVTSTWFDWVLVFLWVSSVIIFIVRTIGGWRSG